MVQPCFSMKQSGSAIKVVGLTGGMGTGKSSVASFLCKNISTEFIDADQVCRKFLEPDEEGWHGLKRTFGHDYFNEDMTVNRQKVRKAIFDRSDVRNQINNILHPIARQEIKERINKFRGKSDKSVMLVEVPLLYEVSWENLFDRVIVVYSRCCQSVKRLVARDNVSKGEAEKALASQWPIGRKAMMADHVIDNSGAWALTCLEVLQLTRVLNGNSTK